jgi:hypothetical protein
MKTGPLSNFSDRNVRSGKMPEEDEISTDRVNWIGVSEDIAEVRFESSVMKIIPACGSRHMV